MSCNRFTLDEYAFFALGALDGTERDLLRAHLSAQCSTCIGEIKEALTFWYLFATLTEQSQAGNFPEPSLLLREKVISIGRRRQVRRALGNTVVKTWMKVAAGVLLAAGSADVSWKISQARAHKEIAAVQSRVEQQISAAKKLESENTALKNLFAASQNAPAVFPGRDSIVSVKDPYLMRDLQQARQTQAAISQALAEERNHAADLEKRLSQTTVLLAAATKDRDDADRQFKKAYDAASLEKERGVSQLSTEVGGYKSKVQDLESQIAHYRGIVDSQTKGIEQHLQMVSLLQSSNVSLIQLRSDGSASTGVALIADGARLAFFPANLPPAPAGHTYQLWLIRDGGAVPVSVGIFSSAARDIPTVQFSNKQLLSGIKALAVTVEPAGGSPQPSGRKLMAGSPKG